MTAPSLDLAAEPVDRAFAGTTAEAGTTARAGTSASPRVDSQLFSAGISDHLSGGYWEWLRAFERDDTAVAWAHPEYVLDEARHAPPSKLPGLLVQATSTGEPGTPTSTVAALVPKRVRTAQVGAIGPSLTLWGYRVAGGQTVGSTNPTLIDAVLQEAVRLTRQQGASFLLLEDLDMSSPVGQQLAALPQRGCTWYAPHGVQPRWRIALTNNPQDYWSKFSGKTLSTLRRKKKKCGATSLRCFTTPEDVAEFLPIASEISAETWQSRQFGLRVKNSGAELVRFTTLARLGLFRSYLWSIDNVPVAFLLGDVSHGRFVYQEVGYRTSYAKSSPGQLMLVDVLEDLLTKRIATSFDFGQGDADYKQLFGNVQSDSGSVWIVPQTVAGSTLLTWLRSSRAVRQTARAIVTRSGWLTRARQWIRYGGAKTTVVSRSTDTDSDATETPSGKA